MSQLNLSPPWYIFYRELNAFFSKDAGVRVVYDDEKFDVKIYCESGATADALTYLLPSEKEFGGVTLKIIVVPANKANDQAFIYLCDKPKSMYDVYNNALRFNEAVRNIVPVSGIMSNPIIYVIFDPEIVQYWTDDLGDANGVRTTLMQEIAKDIFIEKDGVFFCTDLVE